MPDKYSGNLTKSDAWNERMIRDVITNDGNNKDMKIRRYSQNYKEYGNQQRCCENHCDENMIMKTTESDNLNDDDGDDETMIIVIITIYQ